MGQRYSVLGFWYKNILGWTQPWLTNNGYKESLKRTSTTAGTGNADVGRKIHYLTNLSLWVELNWGKKNITSNFSCIVSTDFFAEWELVLSILIIIPLFLIPHFEWVNLSRSIRYSMNLNEFTVFIRKWEKFQPSEEISDIKEIDL